MDEIDRGQEREQLDRELALRAVLDRAKECGDGFCADCGVAIDPRRLAIKPRAECCVDCQQYRERKWAQKLSMW